MRRLLFMAALLRLPYLGWNLGHAQSSALSRCLSSSARPVTRKSVFRLIASVPDRLIAALCVALMLFYAATMPAKAVDRIQHSSAVVAPHDHTSLSGISADATQGDHADHHEDQPDSDNSQDDRLAGGHHHHGDTGPNLLVADAGAGLPIAPREDVHGIRHERQIAGLRSVGPERPPRNISLNA